MRSTRKSVAVAATAVGSILAGGAVGMVAFGGSAGAASSDGSSDTTISAASTAGASSDAAASQSGTDRATRAQETPLAGDDLSKATAAANTAVPGATIERAETDADGDAYEVHVTKADGTRATVKLNADFTVKTVEADQGRGGNGGHGGPHQANGVTETPLTGDDLSKATAAANTAAPGATIVRAETDADGDSFEVHITKADGTRATVKLNADFTVKTVEADQGRGGNGGHGGRGGRGGQAPASNTSTTAASTTN